MTPGDFRFLADLLKDRSGLIVGEDKQYLLDSRLTPVARKHGLSDLNALVGALKTKKDGPLSKDVVEAMTTNESFFFRDMTPFEKFKKVVLPHMKQARPDRSLKIWSAACSSGQEPYSLSMVMKEDAPDFANWRIDILATDLSEEMIQSAKDGVYSQFEVQRGLPVQLMLKYFKQEGDRWRINSDLRKNIRFQTFNLLSPMSGLGKFDVVFCRNVLIYFDQPTKGKVLDAIAKVMAPDGFLFLGGAETVIGVTNAFKPHPDER